MIKSRAASPTAASVRSKLLFAGTRLQDLGILQVRVPEPSSGRTRRPGSAAIALSLSSRTIRRRRRFARQSHSQASQVAAAGIVKTIPTAAPPTMRPSTVRTKANRLRMTGPHSVVLGFRGSKHLGLSIRPAWLRPRWPSSHRGRAGGAGSTQQIHQMRDQRGVRGRHRIVAQRLRPHPFQRLPFARFHETLPATADE